MHNEVGFKKVNTYDVLISILIFSYLISSKFIGISLLGFELLLDRMIILIVILFFAKKFINISTSLIDILLLFTPMILIYTISLIGNIYLNLNYEYINENIKAIFRYYELIIFMYLIYICPNKKLLNNVLFYSMIIVNIVGIMQSFGLDIFESRLVQLLPKTSNQIKLLENVFYRGEIMRISSFFSHALSYGTMLSLYIPYLVYQKHNKYINKKLFIIGFILSNYALILTYSRSGILMVIVFYLFLGIKILTNKKGIKYKELILILSIVILILISIMPLLKGFNTLFPEGKNDLSMSMRMEDYNNVINSLDENIILGRGRGSYYKEYGVAVDNFYLTVLYEQGLIGILLVIVFLVFTFIFVIKNNKSEYRYILIFIILQMIIYNINMDAFEFLEITKLYLIILTISANKREHSYIEYRKDDLCI